MKTDVWLYDYAYNFIRPNQLRMGAAGVEMAYAEIKGNYNFYEKKYEQYHTKVDERLLPNMYAFMAIQNTGTDNFWINKMASFDSRIAGTVMQKVFGGTEQAPIFFEQLGREYRGYKTKEPFEVLINKGKNIVILAQKYYLKTC